MRLYFLSICKWLFFLLFVLCVDAYANDNINCGIQKGQPLTNGYGPWDYTNQKHRAKLPMVLKAHFTRDVERLKKGSTGYIDADIDYTLRAIPNYHRALYAISKYELNKRLSLKPLKKYQTRFYSAECYFKRAIYFQPQDSVTHMLFGMHLHKLKMYSEAKNNYLIAYSLSPQDPELNYNLGLLFVDIGELRNAQKHADIAYAQKYPLQGLKKKIISLSKNFQED